MIKSFLDGVKLMERKFPVRTSDPKANFLLPCCVIAVKFPRISQAAIIVKFFYALKTPLPVYSNKKLGT